MAKEIKRIISAAFGISDVGRNSENKIWTNVYRPALPITPQTFDLGAVWPMVMYIARWGHRRGKGQFRNRFQSEPNSLEARGKTTVPTVASVKRILIKNEDVKIKLPANEDNPNKQSFLSSAESIFCDLLLTDVLENIASNEGHTVQIQRVYPTHYFSSNIDLPETAANLRGVPELVISLLFPDDQGATLQLSNSSCSKKLQTRKLILQPFSEGHYIKSDRQSNLESDQFDEEVRLSIDQLVTIRIAQQCGKAPEKLAVAGGALVENLRILSNYNSIVLRQDITTLLGVFGLLKQRRHFQKMLEASMCLSLTLVMSSTLAALEDWSATGKISEPKDGYRANLFVDASSGLKSNLRQHSENSADLFRSRFLSLSLPLMKMRLLDFVSDSLTRVKPDRPPLHPNPVEFLNFLGELMTGEHEKSDRVIERIEEYGAKIYQELSEKSQTDPTLPIPSGSLQSLNELSSFVISSMGKELTSVQLNKCLRSAMYINSPIGIGKRRDVWRQTRGRRSKKEAISIVLSNVMLDYLVHIHTAPKEESGKPRPLSYPQFLVLLRGRYGLYVDQAPDGEDIPGEVLEQNRRILEARLRDLGLLVGVNDAESMKRLRPRFKPAPIANFFCESEALT